MASKFQNAIAQLQATQTTPSCKQVERVEGMGAFFVAHCGFLFIKKPKNRASLVPVKNIFFSKRSEVGTLQMHVVVANAFLKFKPVSQSHRRSTDRHAT
jgi:hypothetical protein